MLNIFQEGITVHYEECRERRCNLRRCGILVLRQTVIKITSVFFAFKLSVKVNFPLLILFTPSPSTAPSSPPPYPFTPPKPDK
jgi:hypothetical protein